MVKPENPRNYEGEFFLFNNLPLCVLQDYITNEVHEEWKFCAVKVKEESITIAGGTPGHFSKTNDGGKECITLLSNRNYFSQIF